jgi:hypothetical protein
LGKRALFGPPPDLFAGTEPANEGDVIADPFAPSADGRRALFSGAALTEGSGPEAPPAARGRLRLPVLATVTCRSCGVRTPLDMVALTTRLLTSAWIPGRRWSRYLRCPACGRWEWCQVMWGGS